MASNETLRKIISLLAEASAIDPKTVRPEGLLRGYGIDSVRFIDLLVSIEESFGVSLQDSDFVGLETVRDLADFLESRVGTA
ncbi:MAG: acyl carrier protein [Deltaproteobacteria bacterium]|nr:acyl carrier protein [Deltaproteobacteria bacterium]